jgi:hypothetical protein
MRVPSERTFEMRPSMELNLLLGVTRPGIAAAALAISALGGCAELDPTIDNCVLINSEEGASQVVCSVRPEPTGDWSCLPDGVMPPAPPSNPPPQVIPFVLPIVDFANPAVSPVGLEVKLCSTADLPCEMGFPVPITRSEMDPRANVIPVPFGQTTFVRMQADEFITTDYFLGGPMVGLTNPAQPFIQGETIGLTALTTLDSFFEQFGRTGQRDNTKGILALRAIDCLGQRAADVRFEFDEDTGDGAPWILRPDFRVFYDERAAGPVTLPDVGVGGWVNMAPRNYRVKGVLSDDTEFGSAVFTVRPNQLTFAELRPGYAFAR